MDSLVSTQWLSEHLAEPNLVILDCSVHTVIKEDGSFYNHSGRANYEREHIPSAGFADLKGDLCARDAEFEFTVPTPEQFCEAMGKLGVGDDSQVVLYDRDTSFWAARVWWMLRWVGFDRAALLDGGLRRWSDEGRIMTTGELERPAKRLTPKPRPELIADIDEVRAAIDDDSVVLVDTLPEPSYRGEQSIYGRAGHIPSAISLCAMNLLDETGCYRSRKELEAMHKTDRSARTITYCGGGIMASSSAFAMTRLGFSDVAVYTASLQEWVTDPANPLVS